MDSVLHSAPSPAMSDASSSSSFSSAQHTSATTPSPASTPVKAKRRRGDPEDPARKARLLARQARNRASAQNSRDRKKQERETLESEIVSLRERNTHLETKVSEMQKGISALMDFVQILMKDKQQAGSQPSTSIATSSATAPPANVAGGAAAASSTLQTLSSPPTTSQTSVDTLAAPTASTSLANTPVASSSRSSPAFSSNADARHPTAGVDGETRAEKRRKVDCAVVEGGERHQGRSIESSIVENVGSGKGGDAKVQKQQQQQPQQQTQGSEQQSSGRLGQVQSSQTSDAQRIVNTQSAAPALLPAFALDETNQRLASQLFETIFGHLGNEFRGNALSAQTKSQSQDHSEAFRTPMNPEALTSTTIKQEGALEPFASDVTLTSDLNCTTSIDEELMNAIVNMDSDRPDEGADLKTLEKTSTDPWAPSGDMTSATTSSWDVNTLGLDLGLDLNVDIDIDLDSSLASSLGLSDVATDVSDVQQDLIPTLWTSDAVATEAF